MAEVPPPAEEVLLTHFIVSDDVERSRRFYTEVLGGEVAFRGTDSGPVKTSNYPTAGSSSMPAGAQPMTSPPSPWRHHAIPTGSAASSISGSGTSRPCTPHGAPGALIS
jgi:catechol 2,3-dioxygenase-like lactoylglutathione lyase family enzyme